MWEVLSDVGGINGFILSIAALIVSIFATNKKDNYLAGELFSQSGDSPGEHPQRLDTESHNPVFDYLKETLPSFCLRLCCLRPSRLDRLRARAREHFVKEMDVVQLLRHIRFFTSVSKTLLSQEKEKELEILSRRTVLDKSEDESQITDEEPP